MQRKPTHINRLTFEFELNSEEMAHFVFKETSNVAHTHLTRLLEKYLAGINPTDQLVGIDRITLNLGSLDKKDFERQLMGSLEEALRKYIEEAFPDPGKKFIKKP